MTPVPFETISQRAHAIWESEGQPTGKEVEHWLRAERELQAEAAPNSGSSDTPAHSASQSAAALGATSRAKSGQPASAAGARERSPKQENL